MQFASHRPGWHLLEHEWFCYDAVPRIRWLVDQLGLRWTERIKAFLTGQDGRLSGPGYGAHARYRRRICNRRARASGFVDSPDCKHGPGEAGSFASKPWVAGDAVPRLGRYPDHPASGSAISQLEKARLEAGPGAAQAARTNGADEWSIATVRKGHDRGTVRVGESRSLLGGGRADAICFPSAWMAPTRT